MTLTQKYTEIVINILYSLQTKINNSPDWVSTPIASDIDAMEQLQNKIGKNYVDEILNNLYARQITGITSFPKPITNKTVFLTLKGYDWVNSLKEQPNNKIGFATK